MRLSRIAAVTVSLVALGTFAACGEGAAPTDSLAPFEPEIVNTAASFELQATAVSNVSTTQEYGWQNAGSSANVNQATVVTSGTASLTILDADGASVYSNSLSEGGTFTTSTGAPGTWTLQLVLWNCGGDLNFRVETP